MIKERREKASRWLYAIATILVGLLVFESITAQRQRLEHQESINQQLSLLSSTVSPRIGVNHELKIETATQSAANLFECELAQLIGTNLKQLMVQPLNARIESEFETYQNTGILPHPVHWTMRTLKDHKIAVRIIAEDDTFAKSNAIFGLKLLQLSSLE